MEIKEIELKDRNITIFNDVEKALCHLLSKKFVQINQEDECGSEMRIMHGYLAQNSVKLQSKCRIYSTC